jgi:hypothetical protein
LPLPPIVFSLGYQFIKTDSKVITQAERKKQRSYSRKNSLNKPRDFQNHKTRCRSYSKKQIEKPVVVVVKTTTHINSDINQITSTNSEDIERNKDKEANNNFKSRNNCIRRK